MTNLRDVADSLILEAGKFGSTNPKEGEAYVRSAFNRYYYATYYSVRELLFQLDEKWAKANHAEIPHLLEEALVKYVDREINKLVKSKALTRSEESAKKHLLRAATAELASLMRESYQVRVAADYKPEVPVAYRLNNIYELQGRTDQAAKNWYQSSVNHKSKILKICKEIGLVGA